MTKTQVFAFLRSYPFRYSLKTALTLFVAVLLCYYLSLSGEFWIILAAFFVSQTTRGTELKQTIIYFFMLSCAVLLAYFLEKNIPYPHIIKAFVIFFFIGCAYISFTYRFLNEISSRIFIFSLFLLLAVIFPAVKSDIIFNRVTDILIGTIIGIVIAKLFFPFRIARDFKNGMIPLLKIMTDDLQAIKQCLFYPKDEGGNECETVRGKSLQLKKILQPRSGLYPEWIYEVGFNPKLRPGFRFFLVKLERIIEILFSLEYFAGKTIDQTILREIEPDLSRAMEKNAELMEILITFMKDEGISPQGNQVQSDFTSDIVSLNKTVQRIIPGKMELLDISPDYVTLTNIVRNIKDMRELLLQLTFSFPTKQ